MLFRSIVFAVLIAIVRAIAKPLSAISAGSVGGASGMSGKSLRIRLSDDGFWIDGGGVSNGTPITCRYNAGGASQNLDVRYEPGPQGHFVFTGSRPSNVTVSMESGASSRSAQRMGGIIGAASEIDDPPVRGHPPAY